MSNPDPTEFNYSEFQAANLSVMISIDTLQARIQELGRQITNDYFGRDLLLVCVLKGAVFFLSDLARQIDLPLAVDFIAASSYAGGTKSTGEVRILKDLDCSLKGKDVLIVEDIVDTGLTLSYLCDLFARRSARSIAVVTLLDKPERREKAVKIDYVGFEIPNAFVVGYGLDYDERYRNLPFVGVLEGIS
jgi:hypoxanthine phosphoribosyltransferase